MSRAISPEDELVLLLSGTAARRSAARERIVALAVRADAAALTSVLSAQRMLPLVAARLGEATPGELAATLSARARVEVERARAWSLVQRAVTARLASELEGAGIPVVAVKGARFAERIYGDAGLRPSWDIDLLVSANHLGRAVQIIRCEGYDPPVDPLVVDGVRPQLHHMLSYPAGDLPAVDLHWRLHWYESRFSAGLLERSPEVEGERRLRPADELAALLLFFARDGFRGLRAAADLAAWWDACPAPHEAAAETGALAVAHPEIHGALRAAATVSEALVGCPLGRAVATSPAGRRRRRTAIALTNWSLRGDADQASANVTLVDLLLAPPSALPARARAYLLPPARRIAEMYALPPGAMVQRTLWQALHGPKLTLRYGLALWGVRGGRAWAPLPRYGRRR